jgi:hypothetical protein
MVWIIIKIDTKDNIFFIFRIPFIPIYFFPPALVENYDFIMQTMVTPKHRFWVLKFVQQSSESKNYKFNLR